MLPFHFVNQMVATLAGEATEPAVLNEDLAHHLRNTPAPARDPLLRRLLPRALRDYLQARSVARRQERDFIALWEMSPHLLRDIGVVLSDAASLPDHLVAAPERVIDHVASVDPAQVEEARREFPPKPQLPVRDTQPGRRISVGLPAPSFS